MSGNSSVSNTGEFEAFVSGYLLGLSEQEGQDNSGQGQNAVVSDLDFEEAFGAPTLGGPSADLFTPQLMFNPSGLYYDPSVEDDLLLGSEQVQQGQEALTDQYFPTCPFTSQQHLNGGQCLCALHSSQYFPTGASMDLDYSIDSLAVGESSGLLDEACDLALSENGDQPQPPSPSPQEHPIPCGREECQICGIFALPF